MRVSSLPAGPRVSPALTYLRETGTAGDLRRLSFESGGKPVKGAGHREDCHYRSEYQSVFQVHVVNEAENAKVKYLAATRLADRLKRSSGE